MNDQLTSHELRDHLSAHLDSVTPPPPDLEAVRRRSRGRRVRRVAGPGLLAVAAVGVGALVLSQGVVPGAEDVTTDDRSDEVPVAAEGPLDLTGGLRAYASPGERLYLGDTSVELTPGMTFLDTDAVATPYGLVYSDPEGRFQLLGQDGRSEPISKRSDAGHDWHPTAKADAVRPHVVFATHRDETATVTVYDLAKKAVVATTKITCTGGCTDLVIDGIDSGAVFLRFISGTSIWNYDRRESYRFAGRDTRVADVRNGVVLHTGPPPTDNRQEWRFVPGAIDAQLTFDGEHVLYWSDTLEPATAGGAPLTLELPQPAAFFAMDTDGSVLAATAGNPSQVFDCELPSGRCVPIGEMSTSHGDPMFIGVDM